MPESATWLAIWLPASGLLLAVLLARRQSLSRTLLSGPPPAAALIAFGTAVVALSLLNEPTGDEPHYLVLTQSIVQDGDLLVRNNYENGDYLAYYPHPIPDPHVTSIGDIWHPIHNFGLPILASVPYVVAGRPGVVLLLAVISIAGLRILWSALRRAGLAPRVAGITTMTAGLTLPLVSLAGQIYPDVVAFSLVAMALWALLARSMTRREHAILMAAVVLLPWFHVKYVALSIALLLALGLTRFRRATLPWLGLGGLLLAGSVALWAATATVIFGIFPPGSDAFLPQEAGTVGWDELIRTYFLSGPLVGLVGLFLDQQSGLLLASPVYALAIPGIVLLRSQPGLASAATVVFLSLYLPAGFWGIWHAEGSSPARFLLPTVPVLALGVGVVLERAGRVGWMLFTVLAVPSLVHGYLMLTLPSFVRYGDPDTHRNYFVALLERVTGLELTVLLPSFRDVTPLTWLTASVHVAAIALATVIILRADRARGRTEGGPRRLSSAA